MYRYTWHISGTEYGDGEYEASATSETVGWLPHKAFDHLLGSDLGWQSSGTGDKSLSIKLPKVRISLVFGNSFVYASSP
jgi:hypothetical protein